MTRPADVTEDMVARWETSRLAWMQEEPLTSAYPQEAYYSGCYLGEKLRGLGCPEQLSEDICQAAGQRQATFNDYWGVVQWVIEEYKQGRYEKPGPELAERLLHERFGNHPDPNAVLAAMAERHPDKGSLFEKMMTARYIMAYGPPEGEESDDDQPPGD